MVLTRILDLSRELLSRELLSRELLSTKKGPISIWLIGPLMMGASYLGL